LSINLIEELICRLEQLIFVIIGAGWGFSFLGINILFVEVGDYRGW